MDKHLVAGGFLVALALTASVMWLVQEAKFNGQMQRPVPQTQAAAPAQTGQAAPVVTVGAPSGQIVRAPQTQPSTPSAAETSPRQQVSPQPERNGVSERPAEPISEPTARKALEKVGADPAADDVWYAAINDSNLSANARRNLIEDLNETGFPDPRNLTPRDLPLIESRLALIEEVADEAMDDVNAAAFSEAYRDLQNMRARLTGS
ncbi:MAG TPA: hypothetical protein VHM90_16430 [Phycisphaerae bacterium]|nr:hypothetical protein [Phycisphaerae bacterium]